MGIINCLECRQGNSGNTVVCVNCGCPLTSEDKVELSQVMIPLSLLGATIVALGGTYVSLTSSTNVLPPAVTRPSVTQ